MKRKSRTTLNLTAANAAHALGLLIADGKIAAKDVTNALKRREQLIRDLRQKLDALERGAVSAMRESGKKVARKRNITPARRAALKLHGQYLGHARKLSVAGRAKIRAIRQKSGVRVAIAAAKKMA